MRQGIPAKEVAADEMRAVCKRFPHLKGVYDNLTKKSYMKMMRNRISALKSRIKKKAEERELTMLREMARRVFLLQKYELLTEKELELLRIDSDDHFSNLVKLLSGGG